VADAPAAADDARVTVNPEFNTSLLRFSYTSLTTPQSVFDYDVNRRERTLLKRQEVLGGYDPTRYIAERIYAPAADGVKVPISLVYKKDLKKDGSAPLLL
jgi:oligopeptidase B